MKRAIVKCDCGDSNCEKWGIPSAGIPTTTLSFAAAMWLSSAPEIRDICKRAYALIVQRGGETDEGVLVLLRHVIALAEAVKE